MDRRDIRKDKGIVKFVFADHFSGIQVDGATDRLRHIEFRRSDFIEKVHNGSILDFYFGNPVDGSNYSTPRSLEDPGLIWP
ncbi:MAG: hypothetical protein ACOYXT_25625 [Bacteroidota bacterium]